MQESGSTWFHMIALFSCILFGYRNGNKYPVAAYDRATFYWAQFGKSHNIELQNDAKRNAMRRALYLNVRQLVVKLFVIKSKWYTKYARGAREATERIQWVAERGNEGGRGAYDFAVSVKWFRFLTVKCSPIVRHDTSSHSQPHKEWVNICSKCKGVGAAGRDVLELGFSNGALTIYHNIFNLF